MIAAILITGSHWVLTSVISQVVSDVAVIAAWDAFQASGFELKRGHPRRPDSLPEPKLSCL